MTEQLLQFIWQHQYLNQDALFTVEGEWVKIIHPGYRNTNQGPDFLEATLLMHRITMVGNIELHLKSSDWYGHGHDGDKNYNNIVLHVVWEHDREIKDNNGYAVPQLCLEPVVKKVFLSRYQLLMETQSPIPCSRFLPALSPLAWTAWKERLAVERLEEKIQKVLAFYEQSNHHWDQVLWWMVAGNFGMKVNQESFEELAQSIPLSVLAKEKNLVEKIEALLLGQAGLLHFDFIDAYPKQLYVTYKHLKNKYDLVPIATPPLFLRMRPQGFPTIRLAQLAALIVQSTRLFAVIKDSVVVEDVLGLFKLAASAYWDTHFVFDIESDRKIKRLGRDMQQKIVINSVIPVLFAYGHYHKNEALRDKAVQWLQQLKPETNVLLSLWESMEIKAEHALDSQALIHLRTRYCNKNRCMECAVGNMVLRGE